VPPAGPPEWRLLPGDGEEIQPADGARNMAVDAALLRSVQGGGAPAVRLYRWAPACLSFGRNQPARGLYDQRVAAARGIDFVRRPTGGQAVLHDDELTYAVIAPVPALGRPRAAYRRINEALVAALRSLGVPAAVATDGMDGGAGAAYAGALAAGRGSWSDACFRRPAAGEVVVGGRKLVGSAQRVEGGVVLQHGSLLLGGSQSAAEDLLLEGPVGIQARAQTGGTPGWTTLERESGGRPGWAALAAALREGFEGALGISLAPSPLLAAEEADALRLRERFRSGEWTWRL
jgi:lipoyl(octanoyl) transferase